jgi:hypothetical protein
MQKQHEADDEHNYNSLTSPLAVPVEFSLTHLVRATQDGQLINWPKPP